MLQLAQPGDRSAINALAAQVHAMHVSWRPDLYTAAQELYPQNRFSAAVKERRLYVAKFGNSVAGYVLVRTRERAGDGLVCRKVLLIEEFCVDELCRGQGIGTEMMTDVRALAKAFGCTDLQLGVYPQNDPAVSFWQKCGFRIRSIEMQQKV